MEDTGPDTPSKYVVPQLRQRSAESHVLSTDFPPRFNVFDFTNTASRNFGTDTGLTSILEPGLSPSVDPGTAHLVEDHPLLSSPAPGSVMSPSSTVPADPQDPITAFKRFLPKSLREVDPDLYLIAFREQLALQIKEMTLAAKRNNLPQHLVSPLAYLRALAYTVEQVKQPRRHAMSVTGKKKCEQIQRLLDSLETATERPLKENSDGQDKVPNQADGLELNDCIASYDSDLRKELDALKPRVVEGWVVFKIIAFALAVGVLILLFYSRTLFS